MTALAARSSYSCAGKENVKSDIIFAQKILDNTIKENRLATIDFVQHTSCTNGEYDEYRSSVLVEQFSLFEHFKEYIAQNATFTFVNTGKHLIILAEDTAMSIETYSKVTITL